MTSRFAELGIGPALVSGLGKLDIQVPTPIQVTAYPVLAAGKDASLVSETGTGKTLAYLLPLIERVETSLQTVQLMIVVPTHELAIQVHRQCCGLAQQSGLPLRAILLIGGTPINRQIEKLKRKPQIIVGTPGRIMELVERKKLRPHTITALVMDEGDQMLTSDRLPVMRNLLRTLPRDRQMIYASASDSPVSDAVFAELSPDVVKIKAAITPVNPLIEHFFICCEERDKPDLVRSLVNAVGPERAMVFVHRNETAVIVCQKLLHRKVPTVDLHTARTKEERKAAMELFRSGAAQVMVVSDLGARGLDIAGVTHIVNLDVPTASLAYLHRVGRTARAGASGQAFTLLTAQEMRHIKTYEEELGIFFKQVHLREGEVVSGPRPGAPV